MKLNESKVKALQKDALLVSTEAFNQAIKYSFQDTTNNSKAYVLYKICTTIHETEPTVECSQIYIVQRWYTDPYNEY